MSHSHGGTWECGGGERVNWRVKVRKANNRRGTTQHRIDSGCSCLRVGAVSMTMGGVGDGDMWRGAQCALGFRRPSPGGPR